MYYSKIVAENQRMWNICRELLIWERETSTNETTRMKVLQQEMIHIVARGWKIPVTFSQGKKKKKKQIGILMYLTLLKEMFISEGKFRNELRKSMEKSSPTKNNILWIWEKTKKKCIRRKYNLTISHSSTVGNSHQLKSNTNRKSKQYIPNFVIAILRG